MEFTIFTPNYRHQLMQWLALAVALLVMPLSWRLGFWLLIGWLLGLTVAGSVARIRRRLLWQPTRAWVTEDGVAWQRATDEVPAKYYWQTLRAYRVAPAKIGAVMLLWTCEGRKIRLPCDYSADYIAFLGAFEQAVRQHNRANPTAPVAQEPGAISRFFQSRASTVGLCALLAAAVVLLYVQGGQPGLLGFLLLLFGLPYLVFWATYSDRRT